MKRRNQFTQHLRSNNTGLSTSRYIRLMAMAVTQVIIESGMGGYLIGMQGFSLWSLIYLS